MMPPTKWIRLRHGIALFTVVGLATFVAACSNPADGKPAAETSAPVENAATEPAAAADTYTIADSSTLTWVGSKVTGSHNGGFNAFSGTIAVPGGDPAAAQINIEIDANSLYSDNEKLTEHLKSPDFFDTATYPTSTFESTSIAKTDSGYSVTGNLNLHGVSKSITFPASIAVEGDTLNADAEFSILRGDFGINYAGKADDLIRDEVVIKFDITATKS